MYIGRSFFGVSPIIKLKASWLKPPTPIPKIMWAANRTGSIGSTDSIPHISEDNAMIGSVQSRSRLLLYLAFRFPQT
ncbi:hypothetical protein D3C81_2076160 [compost metagenome]